MKMVLLRASVEAGDEEVVGKGKVELEPSGGEVYRLR